ncbi:trypsin beta-like [Oppia nitens]|uniref:trypsin beta-like n=1 Tax=Oppia nitens TaxID=1686743 RepID=UPI0023DC2198|nr:trypsin beta-like [Oppia nitens]
MFKFLTSAALVVVVVAVNLANCSRLSPLFSRNAGGGVGGGGRIVGGRPAKLGEAPWQISLVSKGWFGWSHICGGSLVGKRSVVTAAHCVDGAQPTTLQVKYGGLDRTQLAVTQLVTEIVMHPDWDTSAIDYDYAVLTLDGDIQTNADSVQTIQLIDRAPVSGDDRAQLTGWGNTVGGTSSSPVDLQYAEFRVVDRETCQQQWDSTYPEYGQKITERIVCAGAPASSGCHGDSGGPFVIDQKLAGIVSFGSPKCLQDTTKIASGYANVYDQLDWLNSKIVN